MLQLWNLPKFHLVAGEDGKNVLGVVSETKYYVEVTLIGYLESHVESVSAMKFLDTVR